MKKRYYFLLGFLGLAAILAGWVYETRLRPAVDKADLVIPDNIDYFMTDLIYRSIKGNGSLDFEFHSPRLEHHPLTDISQIDTPSILIVRSSGDWQVDSRQGEFWHEENLLRLSDQVVMRRLGQSPMEIRGQSFVFEPDADRVTSEESVVLEDAQSEVHGEHAVFNLGQGNYTLRKARATYNNEKG